MSVEQEGSPRPVKEVFDLGLPVLGMLRNTQNYVQLAAHGLTLWDVAPGRVERDLPQWDGITAFVDR